MPEPSLALLQTLMERMLEQQRQVMNRLERVERALLAGQRGRSVRRLQPPETI